MVLAKLLSAIFTLSFLVVANNASSAVIVNNEPDPRIFNGWGSNIVGQRVADNFSVAQDAKMSKITVYGTTNSEENGFFEALSDFTISIYSDINGWVGDLLYEQNYTDVVGTVSEFADPLSSVPLRDWVIEDMVPFNFIAGSNYWLQVIGSDEDKRFNWNHSPALDSDIAFKWHSSQPWQRPFAPFDTARATQAFKIEGIPVDVTEPMPVALLGLGIVVLSIARKRKM